MLYANGCFTAFLHDSIPYLMGANAINALQNTHTHTHARFNVSIIIIIINCCKLIPGSCSRRTLITGCRTHIYARSSLSDKNQVLPTKTIPNENNKTFARCRHSASKRVKKDENVQLESGSLQFFQHTFDDATVCVCVTVWY